VEGRRGTQGEEGFTLVEMVVATTLLAGSLLALAHLMYSSMSTLGAVRQRSVHLERATEEMEALRALPWGETGACTSDPDYATAYPGGSFEGRAAVAVATCGLPAVSTFTGAEPYTVRRWVTVGPGGAGSARPRRLDVSVEWSEEGTPRSVRLTSLRYPGGLGPDDGTNQLPTVTATATPPSAIAGVTSVAFDATGADPDGDTLTYAWDFGDGTGASGASVTHVYAATGAYTATVTVTDGNGGSAVHPIDVTAATPGVNQAPIAVVAATTVTTGTAPFSVSFDASGSYDPDGDAITYRWIWGDGSPDGVGVSATHLFTGADTYTVTLVVTDPAAATGTAHEYVTTTPLNCDVTDGYFQNPVGASQNVIDLKGNGTVKNTSFSFRATSNSACTSVTANIPHASGTFSVPLSVVGTNSSTGEVTWGATQSVGGSVKFSVGTYQTGEFVGTGPSPQTDRQQLSFQVKK
jgi:PKD repeat protein